MVQSETWKKELERNEWESIFMKGAETRKYLDAQYAGYRLILAELGLVK